MPCSTSTAASAAPRVTTATETAGRTEETAARATASAARTTRRTTRRAAQTTRRAASTTRRAAAQSTRRAAKPAAPPITGYDDLTADEIVAKLPEQPQTALVAIAAYEQATAKRATVLQRVAALSGPEPAPGYDELNADDAQKLVTGGSADARRRRARLRAPPQGPRERHRGRHAPRGRLLAPACHTSPETGAPARGAPAVRLSRPRPGRAAGAAPRPTGRAWPRTRTPRCAPRESGYSGSSELDVTITAGPPLVGREPLGDREAVDVRQAHVEQHDVRAAARARRRGRTCRRPPRRRPSSRRIRAGRAPWTGRRRDRRR